MPFGSLRLGWIGLAAAVVPVQAAEPPAQKLFSHFAEKYCLECHDVATQKGDREFETFKFPLANEASLITAKDIVDQLTLREMPPKKAAQPSDEERLAVIRVLRDGITSARGKIAANTARASIGGVPPPCGRRGGGGISGAARLHNSSGTHSEINRSSTVERIYHQAQPTAT